MTTAKGLYRGLATILNGTTTSNTVDTGGGVLAGMYVPVALTGTSVSFTAATDPAGTFLPLRDATGALVTVTLNAAAAFYSLRSILPYGVDFLKVVSASNEAAARDITLVFQKVL